VLQLNASKPESVLENDDVLSRALLSCVRIELRAREPHLSDPLLSGKA